MECRPNISRGGVALSVALSVALAIFSLTSCQHALPKVAAGPPPPSPSPAVAPATAQPAVIPAAPANSQPSAPAKTETLVEVTPPTVAPPVSVPETKDVPPLPDKTTASKPVTHAAPKPAAPNPPAPDPKPKTDPAPTPATPAGPVAPAAPAPRIEATLPPAEQNAYRKRAEKAILDTRQNLYAIKDAHLNRDDQSTLRQAYLFLRDAEKSLKAGDLVGAATLAEKSRLLSQELRKRYGS